MSLAKATFSGVVYREPQMRFTTNNVPITYFTFNIGQNDEEDLIRVRALGKTAETVEKTVMRNDRLVVEGNLTLVTIKDENGAEKRIVELAMISFEKLSDSGVTESSGVMAKSESSESENLVKFTNDGADDLIGEDEIPF